ncbi:hypothetical protein P9112_003545 [Eukaryota sp. TZLM1-RC]
MPLTFRILSEVKSAQQLLSLNLHCSDDTRARACAAHRFQPLTQKEIAKQYSVSQSTISRWLKQSFDSYLWGPYRRRKNRILDSSEVTTLLSIVDVDPQLFLHQMKKIALQLFSKTLSETTLYRILKDAKYSHKLSQKILSKCKQSYYTILSALESLRLYDCSSLFEHAGWTNGQFYHSPYLNNSKLVNCIEMDIENDRTEYKINFLSLLS